MTAEPSRSGPWPRRGLPRWLRRLVVIRSRWRLAAATALLGAVVTAMAAWAAAVGGPASLPRNQTNGGGVHDRGVAVIPDPRGAPGQALTTPLPKKPTPTPTLTSPIPTPTMTHCTPTWSPTTFYVPGQKVRYAGHVWLAVYFSTDVVPNLPSSSLYWRDMGAC